LRIAVDAHVLSGKFQGSRTYLNNLYSEVLKLNRIHDFFFLGNWNDSEGGDSSFNPKIKFNSNSRIKRLTYEPYILLKNKDINFYHTQYISPLITPANNLVTIHDILFEEYPEYFNRAEVIRNRIMVKNSAKKAKIIHTVSNYSKKMIVECYGIDPGKIKIVSNGVDTKIFNPDDKTTAQKYIMKKYQIQDYILTVGRIEPRKNHLGLIKAYQLSKQENKSIGKLVIVGQPDFKFNDVFDYIKANNLQNDIKILSNIDNEDLPLIYKCSKLFVYPSYAEGFGIPPLEAMASGVPVISSDNTAIREVIGDAGILIKPNETESIAHNILTLINDSYQINKLVDLGLSKAKEYSWENAAKQYLKSLEDY
jgi:glycosyltransferase involved in cell wall biosynthesis